MADPSSSICSSDAAGAKWTSATGEAILTLLREQSQFGMTIVMVTHERALAEKFADRLAIMGRPNVGKSSLLNALLGDERALVSAVPGTTRDPVDTELIFDNIPVMISFFDES